MSKGMGRPRVDPDQRKSVMISATATMVTKRAVQAEARNQDRTVGAIIRLALAEYLEARNG